MRASKTTLAMAFLLTGASASMAAELRDGEVYLIENFEGLALQFEVEAWPKDAQGVTFTLSPPASVDVKDRKVNFLTLAFGGKVPEVNLASEIKGLVDGVYGYEIAVGTQKQIKKKEVLDNGREENRDYDLVSYLVSGSFVIEGGKIFVFDQGDEKGVEKPVTQDPIDDRDTGEDSKPEKPVDGGRDINDRDK